MSASDKEGAMAEKSEFPGLPNRPKKCASLLRHSDAVFGAFALHADKKPRYRVGGFTAGTLGVKCNNARKVWRYYADPSIEGLLGRRIVLDETTWSDEYPFDWEQPLNYPTFLKASKGEPVLFPLAVKVLATFEAYSLAVNGQDIYELMDIIPCSYNVDRFNTEQLSELRRRCSKHKVLQDFDPGALKATLQKDAELFDRMASGECVTKETATRLLKYLESIADELDLPKIWEVRAYPGKKRLGLGPACQLEMVNTDTKPKAG
jgi:hypothetical protein